MSYTLLNKEMFMGIHGLYLWTHYKSTRGMKAYGQKAAKREQEAC